MLPAFYIMATALTNLVVAIYILASALTILKSALTVRAYALTILASTIIPLTSTQSIKNPVSKSLGSCFLQRSGLGSF